MSLPDGLISFYVGDMLNMDARMGVRSVSKLEKWRVDYGAINALLSRLVSESASKEEKIQSLRAISLECENIERK